MTQHVNTQKQIKVKRKNFKDTVKLSFGEEVANSVSHGVFACIALCLLPYVAVKSYLHGGTAHAVCLSIYVISIFLMFLSSTVYHTMENRTTHKYVLRIIDHSMIFISIVGTYTPILVIMIGGWLGWTVLAILWGITIFGILYKVLATHVNPKFSMAMYMVMGWMSIILIPIIIQKASIAFLIYILLGGVAYTIGAWFYAQKHRAYFHMIWHLFIVVASSFHYIAIMYYM
ncbi:PAQR family membrane homeostasis protein TrhA [Staphylococcus massiliensis]|uniref:Putative hemolysin III n=1 Tax=Staphylococcus massiliensis S46 TaxID=1229783 RepID=K9AWG0_9STAP|nr:hemolysin III family protein [Staphylococcus massiliensis]EKU45835.1 putative hemolysin III [Staphylococcus massiliensis S46]MCG3399320.1 hemolysin III family protein [Staphylococcus massiliensis]MCG3402578.1 hemolysin III family protein [Staphylococcus massiliensis]MCG3413323.1 hemolysin III family protein [Staphylococcus massiliensis]POA00660.1 hemolysin III [Staphylococcus massiliensis CCUG 55927]